MRDNKYTGGSRAQESVCCSRRRAGSSSGGWSLSLTGTSQPRLALPSDFLPELAGTTNPMILFLCGGTLQHPFRWLLLQRSVYCGGGYNQLLG